jgi:hypothetical protein
MVDIKEKVMANPLITKLLSQLDEKEKEKTILVVSGMLEELQGKADGLRKAIEEASKKEQSK